MPYKARAWGWVANGKRPKLAALTAKVCVSRVRKLSSYLPHDWLVDEFKRPDSELTVAISVDMLDTGIDVPQIVNLEQFAHDSQRLEYVGLLGSGRIAQMIHGP